MNPSWKCSRRRDWGNLVQARDELWMGWSTVAMDYGSQIHGFHFDADSFSSLAGILLVQE